MEFIKTYYDNGQIATESYLDGNNHYHNEDGPAYLKWHENGKQESIVYFQNSECHCEDGPAYQVWDEDGQVRFEKYFLNNKEYTQEEFNAKLRQQKLQSITNQNNLRVAQSL